MSGTSTTRWVQQLRLLLAATLLLLGSGCAMVTMKEVVSTDYMVSKRGDILTASELSSNSQETLSVVGLDEDQCAKDVVACRQTVLDTDGISIEQRLSTLSELWVQTALQLSPKARHARTEPMSDAAVDAWLEAARYAYAYLFFSGRSPRERAFEDRQTQVRDYYNYAAEQTASVVFKRARTSALEGEDYNVAVAGERWTLTSDYDRLSMPSIPTQLIAAGSVSFAGLRSSYRRDGFGAELVVVMDPPKLARPLPGADAAQATQGGAVPLPGDDGVPEFSEMSSINATALLRFKGDSLEQVLATTQVLLDVYSPEATDHVEVHGERVPLAGNFTAAYGLWLAQSGFATQSLRTLFGLSEGIAAPHIYLMQPYDPNRRIIFMLHGLGSSPEAWVNVANEIMGEQELRREYQVWQVYYPTNAPIALNRYEISKAFNDTLRHFDPSGQARASKDMVFIGHSMGGVLARLLLSSSGEVLWDDLLANYELKGERLKRVQAKLGPLLHFDAQPNVERAIFIAAPHRGTDIAGNRVGRLIGRLVRLPLTILGAFEDVFQTLQQVEPKHGAQPLRIPNSIDNLKASDPFVEAAAQLPLRPGLKYHSIIAHRKPQVPLQQSDDGLVPYWSAHLDGALSEKVIVSGHSVQETPQAVLEIRRILREDVDEVGARPH
ncbi:alpha/beta hydrolase [Stenotrophomonas sp. C3(2023)]|uniref:esterase/lipase family protein n=1 Tax=Stenotrophomonas sp. C3(2023) TaxID=3080277 RepID=UPI00293C57AA|nr:alpha/beta hydrolase [Stenotrophomonas sp. C3(2023)]MDV3467762.1 alpha/beta hydrolase [Stenotrophomonas sp. C3(2023)]